MREVTFTRVFSAAHRLWSDSSKCSNIHGHNYRVKVKIKRTHLGVESGMVVPFALVKEEIDKFDHKLILDVSDPQKEIFVSVTSVVLVRDLPTTENMAQFLADDILLLMRNSGDRCEVFVTLTETDNIEAHGYATG
ncbi:MAG TPA: 6-carboxytetrahydropterin synthase [Ktedonobacteraceae bacterium]